jgi:hypothetical protein
MHFHDFRVVTSFRDETVHGDAEIVNRRWVEHWGFELLRE